MKLALQIVRKDLRRYWPLASFVASYILLETLAPLWGVDLDIGRSFHSPDVLAMFAKWPVIFILVVAVMQEDRTVGDRAFWRTRPIGPGALLAGKLLLFGFAIALPAALANLAIAMALDTPWPVTLGIAIETIGFMLLAVLAAAVTASVTGTLIHAGLVALGGLLVVVLLAAVREALAPYATIRLPWDTDVAFPGPRIAFACVLASVALAGLLAHQFYTRRTGRTAALLGVAVPLVLGASLTWTLDVTPPSRAASFPAKPLLHTEAATISLELPARVWGAEWLYDAATRRHHHERFVTAYADLDVAIPGRYFEVLEGRTDLQLRDGREIKFPPTGEYGYTWNGNQREAAILRALGLPTPDRPHEAIQGTLRLFSARDEQLAVLGGKHGRLTATVVLGETAFREQFRLRARAGGAYHEPGMEWRLDGEERTDEGQVQIRLSILRATTMLAPGGQARADFNDSASNDRLYILLNRSRAEYAFGWPNWASGNSGIVATSRNVIVFRDRRRVGATSSIGQPDDTWLADAEFVVVQTERLGKTEKTVVVEDFEIPLLTP